MIALTIDDDECTGEGEEALDATQRVLCGLTRRVAGAKILDGLITRRESHHDVAVAGGAATADVGVHPRTAAGNG